MGALGDHAVLVTLVLRLLAKAGVSDLEANGVVASIQRRPLSVFGLAAEVYTITVPRSVHGALSGHVTDLDPPASLVPSDATMVTYFVEFCRMWIDSAPQVGATIGRRRHLYAAAKQAWLCNHIQPVVASPAASPTQHDSEAVLFVFRYRFLMWRSPPFDSSRRTAA